MTAPARAADAERAVELLSPLLAGRPASTGWLWWKAPRAFQCSGCGALKLGEPSSLLWRRFHLDPLRFDPGTHEAAEREREFCRACVAGPREHVLMAMQRREEFDLLPGWSWSALVAQAEVAALSGNGWCRSCGGFSAPGCSDRW